MLNFGINYGFRATILSFQKPTSGSNASSVGVNRPWLVPCMGSTVLGLFLTVPTVATNLGTQ